MKKTNDTNLYDIEKLISIWNSGWKNLARLEVVNKNVVIECFGREHENLIQQAMWGFREVIMLNAGIYYSTEDLISGIRFLDSILLLTKLKKRNCFDIEDKLDWRKKIHQFWDWDRFFDSRKNVIKDRKTVMNAIKKTTNYFAKSLNYREALQKLTTKDNLDMFIRYWSKRKIGFSITYRNHGLSKLSLEEFFSFDIQPRWQKAFRWLSYGLANPKACEEAWWNCVWIYMEPIIDKLLKIKKSINSEIPLTDDQIQLLNHYMDYGSPHIHIVNDFSGKCFPRVVMQQTMGEVSYCDSSCGKMSDILLVQPAYALAQEFQDKCKKPRFIIQCHAPSCGKSFYTGRKNATACPSKESDRKSRCQLEWIQYKRWLLKININPYKNWHKTKYKKLFLDR